MFKTLVIQQSNTLLNETQLFKSHILTQHRHLLSSTPLPTSDHRSSRMALQTTNPFTAPDPQVVANAFVEQYYHILHHSPELVHRFYQDSSVLSRQEENGQMTSVTTMQGINAKILSLDYKNYRAEILTADAQESYKDGVIVLVTGCLTGKENVRKKFAQSFFLAPQSKGYFVLNDVFRYVDESKLLDPNAITIDKADDSRGSQTVIYTEPSDGPVLPVPVKMTSIEDNQTKLKKSSKPVRKERQAVPEDVHVIPQSENHVSSVALSSQMAVEEDSVKNSYASIVKKATDNNGSTKVYVAADDEVKVESSNIQEQSCGLLASTSAAPERVNANEEGAAVEGFSIFVRNLPANVIDDQLEQEFKRFGPIKPNGVQVRSNSQQGSCYGFVEFLSSSSLEKAIQASPITIGGRQCFVEIKRTVTHADNGRGRFPYRRGGFRSESFRGRGGYNVGHTFSGNGVVGRREYVGRGRGSDRYQRGRGRAGRGTDQRMAASLDTA